MAYTDYAFYTDSFYGDVLAGGTANKYLERASDEVNTLTHRRLEGAFPTIEADAVKVKKAVCAVAEALYLVDYQRKAVALQQTADGGYRGVVSSISSGRESISYSTGTAASVYAAAAADDEKLKNLISDIAVKYLANVPDANGTNLLYAGWGC